MKKELKDFLYLYPGVTLLCPDDDGRLFECRKWHIDSNGNLDVDGYLFDWSDDPKPILKPLRQSSFIKYGFAFFDAPTKIEEIKAWASCINRLRKNGFDCDDLISSGLAVDATTLKETNPLS